MQQPLTAAAIASYFPPLDWPKPEENSGFFRPQTAPVDKRKHVDRVNSPRSFVPASPRPTSTSSPRAGKAGAVELPGPVAQSMINRQKQAALKLESQNEVLERRQKKMQSKMDVMEYETRCLRTGAIHPQNIVDQLDDIATGLEEENVNLLAEKLALEAKAHRLEEHVRSLQAQQQATHRELAQERDENALLLAKVAELERKVAAEKARGDLLARGA